MITKEVGLLTVAEALHVVRYTSNEELRSKVLLCLKRKKLHYNRIVTIFRRDLGLEAHGKRPSLPLDADRAGEAMAACRLVEYMETVAGVH